MHGQLAEFLKRRPRDAGSKSNWQAQADDGLFAHVDVPNEVEHRQTRSEHFAGRTRDIHCDSLRNRTFSTTRTNRAGDVDQETAFLRATSDAAHRAVPGVEDRFPLGRLGANTVPRRSPHHCGVSRVRSWLRASHMDPDKQLFPIDTSEIDRQLRSWQVDEKVFFLFWEYWALKSKMVVWYNIGFFSVCRTTVYRTGFIQKFCYTTTPFWPKVGNSILAALSFQLASWEGRLSGCGRRGSSDGMGVGHTTDGGTEGKRDEKHRSCGVLKP